MTDLPQQLEDKKKELKECELVIQDDNKSEEMFKEVLNIKLESKEYLELDVEQQCSLIMVRKAEIAILEQAIAEIENIQSQQLKNSLNEGEDRALPTRRPACSDTNRLDNNSELSSADISNLLQKQRQEILYIFKEAGAKNRMSCLNEDGTRNYFIHFTPKEWGELLLQLNQPKTEE